MRPLESVISVQDLTKSFGSSKILDSLFLEVEPGETHGFLGPNGAGKSTTLRILLALLKPDSGVVRVLGKDPWLTGAQLHASLAYVPGDVELWPNLTGGEIIELLGNLRGSYDKKRCAGLIEHFELDPSLKARTYSTGNRQKVVLVSALSADVPLLILDEPTSGLDPLMEEVFRECIREANGLGRTVLLSSHILSEVESLCHRVTIIRDGRTVHQGALSELRALTGTEIEATVATADGLLEELSGITDIRELSVRNNEVNCIVGSQSLQFVLEALVGHGTVSLTSSPPSLESLFVDFYRSPSKKELRNQGATVDEEL